MKRLILTLGSVAVLSTVFALGYFAGAKERVSVPTVMAAPALTNPDNLNGSWQVNVNGNQGTLTLNQDSGGALSGLMNTGGGGFGQFLIGFYNRRDGRLVFLRVIPDLSGGPNPNEIIRRTAAKSQVFLGSAFISGSETHIAGAFFNFSPQASEGGGSADQFNFGWLAQK